MPDKPQRAIIEYKEFPVTGKPRVMSRVIDDVKGEEDAYRQFYASRTWPVMTRKPEILSIRWPEEE